MNMDKVIGHADGMFHSFRCDNWLIPMVGQQVCHDSQPQRMDVHLLYHAADVAILLCIGPHVVGIGIVGVKVVCFMGQLEG